MWPAKELDKLHQEMLASIRGRPCKKPSVEVLTKYRAELAALGTLPYPLVAVGCGRAGRVLGPANWFEPYLSDVSPDGWMLFEKTCGSRAIMRAESIVVWGCSRSLVTRVRLPASGE